MGERRPSAASSRIEDRIREVFMSRPQSRSRGGELTSEAVRSAKLAEAMQRQLTPLQTEESREDLNDRISVLQQEFEEQVRELEEELRRKVAALRKDLEAKIARETADWTRRQSARTRQSPVSVKSQSRAYSTPRVRANDTEEEETKPKEAVRSALQRLQESKVKLSEYQTLLRTPTRTPQAAQKADTMPKQVDSADFYAKRVRATPQTETKAKPKAEELPVRPKSLYERILALQKKG